MAHVAYASHLLIRWLDAAAVAGGGLPQLWPVAAAVARCRSCAGVPVAVAVRVTSCGGCVASTLPRLSLVAAAVVGGVRVAAALANVCMVAPALAGG